MAPLSERERRENARAIMAQNIDSHPVGRKLTPEARERAIEFAVDSWKGSMGNGKASELGIQHVTQGILKQE
jgi:hypothetical protein